MKEWPKKNMTANITTNILTLLDAHKMVPIWRRDAEARKVHSFGLFQYNSANTCYFPSWHVFVVKTRRHFKA